MLTYRRNGEMKMKRYKFIIRLSNGNKIQGTSVGNDQDDAMGRLLSLPQANEFIGTAQITDTVLVGEEIVQPVPANRFELQRSTDAGWWLIGDPSGIFVIKFKEHDFNGTHKTTYLKDGYSEILDDIHVLREMTEWLKVYHPEVL